MWWWQTVNGQRANTLGFCRALINTRERLAALTALTPEKRRVPVDLSPCHCKCTLHSLCSEGMHTALLLLQRLTAIIMYIYHAGRNT